LDGGLAILATSDLRSPDFAQSFAGMHLPREVIDKIYRRNAESMFKGAWALTARLNRWAYR
jgi:hypothetical protein